MTIGSSLRKRLAKCRAGESLSLLFSNVESRIDPILKRVERFGYTVGVIGGVMNFVVITANGDKMPVFGFGRTIESEIHCDGGSNTWLSPLSDWINLKFVSDNVFVVGSLFIFGVPRNKRVIVSPGDILMFISCWFLVLPISKWLIANFVKIVRFLTDGY